MTLDGVIQNEENDGDGFKWGGWFFPFADEVTGAVVQERLAKPVDLLLGRKTFDGWETYWPTHSNFWPNVMTATKYVASNTRDSSDWQPSCILERRPCRKGPRAQTNRRTRYSRIWKCRYAANALQSRSRRRARANDHSRHDRPGKTPLPRRHDARGL